MTNQRSKTVDNGNNDKGHGEKPDQHHQKPRQDHYLWDQCQGGIRHQGN